MSSLCVPAQILKRFDVLAQNFLSIISYRTVASSIQHSAICVAVSDDVDSPILACSILNNIGPDCSDVN